MKKESNTLSSTLKEKATPSKVKDRVTPTLVFVFVWVVCFIVDPYNIKGDQVFYRRVYDYFMQYDLTITQAYIHYYSGSGGSEPVPFLVDYFFSRLGIEKDIIMGIANAVLFTLAYKICFKLSQKRWLSLFVVFTNFYLWVFAFSGERLKFGMILLFLSILYNNRILFVGSFLGHLQMGVLIPVAYLSRTLSKISFKFRFRSYTRLFLTAVFLMVGAYATYIFLGDKILSKLHFYATYFSKGFFSVFKMLAMLPIGLLFTPKNKRLSLVIAIFILSVIGYVIGEQRTLLFVYFYVIYYTINYPGVNYGLLLLGCYYLYKSVDYFYKLIIFGNGF